MMARNARAVVNVIALIGERGREVREFIEKDLGPEGLKRSVVVVVTGDKSPLLRVRGAFVAAAIAEQFCGMGADVLLMMDSVTRFCMAQREIGLSIGEPPASKGYTPSVFAMLPRLLERSGAWEGKGSITGLYTVLVDGDDMDEPIADAVRSILDGHIVLSRQLAARNHYPPIDVLNSVSRCMSSVSTKQHLQVASELRELMAVYQTNEDLINIGAYVRGANPKLDQAVGAIDRIRAFLRQRVDEPSNLEQSAAMMQSILAAAGVAIPR
jgi:flagellum-specific ATP synthase